MKTQRMQIKTFIDKVDKGFKFRYARFKNWGWTGDCDWIKDDLSHISKNNIRGIVEVRIEEQSDIEYQKKCQSALIKERDEQERLRKLFKFSFGYSSTIANNLTANKYIFRIDVKHKILKRSWMSVTSYSRLDQSELKEYQDEYNNIKVK